ncbi:MAG: VOC family protein [Betaproteobacteria bacterium]|nr:VOC family protein [Betaproteobacteria bacterium]
MAKVIHNMVRVLDLGRSLKFYDEVLGMKPVHRLPFPSFELVYLRNAEGDTEIELTLNRDRTEPYSHGDGYGHIGVVVDDAAADRVRLQALGYAPGDVKEFKADNGDLIARYFFIQDPDGYKIEVLERHGHYR